MVPIHDDGTLARKTFLQSPGSTVKMPLAPIQPFPVNWCVNLEVYQLRLQQMKLNFQVMVPTCESELHTNSVERYCYYALAEQCRLR
jgi:hypothetical protein